MSDNLDGIVRRQGALLRPPKQLRLSEWADSNFRLSRESASEPGPWRSYPFQRAWLDAIGDPKVEKITLLKSSRCGATKCLGVAIAYFISEDPCPMLFYLPTHDEARRFSRREIAPMLRDVACLAGKVADPRTRDADNTIQDKTFPGGSLELCGANAPTGFRSRTARLVFFDELDGMAPSAGVEGDQVKLGMRRTATYWNRKVVCVSTPTMAEDSRIEKLFYEGTQERFWVPCPVCKHYDTLEWQQEEEGVGHWFHWEEGHPETARFFCSGCGVAITHDKKEDMVAAGEWRPAAEFNGHRSYSIWAAYSSAPHAAWATIAADYEEAKRAGEEQLRAFHNTVLGKSWKVSGDSPDWERLYRRREKYQIGTVPPGVGLLTAGVDIQAGCAYYEIVGWGVGKESWSIEAGVIAGVTSSEDSSVWTELDALLDREWLGADGVIWKIQRLAIDSGFNTSSVYYWGHKDPARVIVCKGMGSDKAISRMLLGTPSPTTLKPSGKASRRGLLWPVGAGICKAEFYAWLKLDPPLEEGGRYPSGFVHFPEHGEDWFKQITSECLVTTRKRNGFTVEKWQVKSGRQNHWLDCRVLNRAAAAKERVDLLTGPGQPYRRPPSTGVVEPAAPPRSQPRADPWPVDPPRARAPWVGSGTIGRGRGPWLGRR